MVLRFQVKSNNKENQQQSVSHYDELWGRISTTLRRVYHDLQEYAGKVKVEQEAFEKKKQEQIAEIHKNAGTQIESGSTELQQEKAPMVSSSSTTSTTVDEQIKKIQSEPFKSSLPPFNTPASVSQHSERTENFLPDLFWMISPTTSKIFCDNVEKSKRTAFETMKRIEENNNKQTTTAMKPQPVTEKGAQWVQVDVERFVISNLVSSNQENNVFDLIEENFSSNNKENDSTSKNKWIEELTEQLQGPFIDGVLIPLPITVESSEAMKELLALFRRAPPSICIQPPVVDKTQKAKKGKAQAASDCVVQ